MIASVSREIMHRIVSMEIALYKISLNDTRKNIYGESNSKIYEQPIRLFTLINKEDTNFQEGITEQDVVQNVQFKFLREDLVQSNVFISEGDIIKFDEKFYEIDNTRTTQYFMGRNPDTFLMNTEGRANYQFGYNIAISAQCHLTKLSSLNLVEIRSGVNHKVNQNPINQ